MDTCVLLAARGPPGPIFSVIDKVAFTLEKLLGEVNAIMTALKTYSAPNYIIVWSSRCGVLKSRLGNTIRENILFWTSVLFCFVRCQVCKPSHYRNRIIHRGTYSSSPS